MSDIHVVLGAGPLGLAVADELTTRGTRARVVTRSGTALGAPAGCECRGADISDASQTQAACAGAVVVYHCANAPYDAWPAQLPGMMRGAIAGAAAAGAKLVYGDNLYMYGPVDGPLHEDLPARATGPKGRVRAEVARMLLDAHGAGTLRAAIARGSDFYGPRVLQSHAGERAFPRALAAKPADVIGDPDQPHTFTYIRDFARVLVNLGARDEALGAVWHVPSAKTITTRQFMQLVYAEAGTTLKLRAASRRMMTVLGLFMPVMRELKEVCYQFERPFVVNGTKYVSAFGDPTTPLRDAIRETLNWYRSRPM